jgi:hypothetical protein
MITANLEPVSMLALAVESPRLKAFFIEPLLVLGVFAFWLVALPFVAVSLVAVKVWDTFRPDAVFLPSGIRANQFTSQHTTVISSTAHA